MKWPTQCVLGASYGDEGKGKIVDFLVHRHKATVVVRFNGGAQAGHTVVTPDGRRHVFSHFGSGSFLGAKTFLSRHFVVNPILFFKEKALLLKHGIDPEVLVDPSAIITTPYDMIINQAIENARTVRHGSCGVGFGETIERNTQYAPGMISDFLRICMSDCEFDEIRFKLELIRRVWVPTRIENLGICYTDEIKKLVMDDRILNHFINDLIRMHRVIRLMKVEELSSYRLVFEGAQGLALDQSRGSFPHVTRSNTGLENVIEICNVAGIEEIETHFVTRAYLTRHGAGPLPNELSRKPYQGIKETTNVTNEYQGKFRYAHLDASSLRARIHSCLNSTIDTSIKIGSKKLTLNTALDVTCVDKLDDYGKYRLDGKLKSVSSCYFAESLAQDIGFSYFSTSLGPTRKNVYQGKVQ